MTLIFVLFINKLRKQIKKLFNLYFKLYSIKNFCVTILSLYLYYFYFGKFLLSNFYA